MHCNTLMHSQATCSYIDSFFHTYTYVAALPLDTCSADEKKKADMIRQADKNFRVGQKLSTQSLS